MNCRIWLVENRYRFDAVSTDIQEMMRLPIGHLRVFQSVASVRVTKCLPLTFVAVRAPFLIALITCWRERPVWAATSRSEEHTSELQSLMRISYAVFCLKKKKECTYQLAIYSLR